MINNQNKINKYFSIMSINWTDKNRFYDISCKDCKNKQICYPTESAHENCPIFKMLENIYQRKIVGVNHGKFETMVFMDFHKKSPNDVKKMQLISDILDERFRTANGLFNKRNMAR